MFGIHVVSGIPSGSIFYKDEAMLNSADEFRIKLTGQQVHASMPWAGRDPIVASAAIINNIQTMISRRSDLTKGMVSDNGRTYFRRNCGKHYSERS